MINPLENPDKISSDINAIVKNLILTEFSKKGSIVPSNTFVPHKSEKGARELPKLPTHRLSRKGMSTKKTVIQQNSVVPFKLSPVTQNTVSPVEKSKRSARTEKLFANLRVLATAAETKKKENASRIRSKRSSRKL